MDKKPVLMKQKPMSKVLYALYPLALAGVYFFGWRTLLILAVVNAAGFLCEYIFSLVYKKQVTQAVFVTNFLFALSLPPTIPIWIAIVGICFGVIFGKMVFGGFGRNVFNPALTGRAFIYISFGKELNSMFVPSFSGFPGGFAAFLHGGAADAVSAATPLAQLSSGKKPDLFDLIFGPTAGSIGETAGILIILGGLYLMFSKTANFRIILSGIVSFITLQTIFYFTDQGVYANPVYYMFAGSFLFAIMFMATDPVSASQTTNLGRWIYGAIIGLLSVLIRNFSIWPEAMTFSILLANTFAPLIDYLIKEAKKKRAAA